MASSKHQERDEGSSTGRPTLAMDAGLIIEPTNEEPPPPQTVVQVHNDTPPDIPLDGGTQAWLQVAASFALYFNHLGLLNSFGVFQAYYETGLLKHSSPSAISWIGSTQVFCLMAVGAVIGPLYDIGYCRTLLVVGTLLVTLGFMLTSIGTQYWHIFLAQGVCIGLGACCLSIPSIAIVPMYFRKRRATAMGLATVGSGLGSTLYPLMFQKMQAELGFGWTMRIMGFIVFAMCLFSIAVFRPRGFALSHGMQSHTLAQYLLAILNASSIPGRIIPSSIADRVGSLDTYIVVCALSSTSVFYWISVTNAAGNIAFAVLYGFFSGAVVSLGAVVLTSITSDMSRLGTRLGMVSIVKGVGSLIGPPISGAILSRTGSYLGIQLFAACGIMLTSLFALVLRLVIARRLFRAIRDDDGAYAEANHPSKAAVSAQTVQDK
ncbi:MFS-type transporter dbaD [Cladobotryum mycophilum]|uniref:MFS-type transporter dbaD n=1 Tax=Cladobotryum mycophilum TaxID=491253 RepID=A0ABR0T140_9HYPO